MKILAIFLTLLTVSSCGMGSSDSDGTHRIDRSVEGYEQLGTQPAVAVEPPPPPQKVVLTQKQCDFDKGVVTSECILNYNLFDDEYYQAFFDDRVYSREPEMFYRYGGCTLRLNTGFFYDGRKNGCAPWKRADVADFRHTRLVIKVLSLRQRGYPLEGVHK